MSKRSYQNLGVALMLIPVVVALAIQLWTGGVIATNPPETIGQGTAGNVGYTAFVVRLSFHWAVLLPLLLLFVTGFTCVVISSRRTR